MKTSRQMILGTTPRRVRFVLSGTRPNGFMTNLLIVLPFCVDDAPLAERLLDWIYQLSGKRKQGHILLVAAADVHPEFVERCKISAELGFETVDVLTGVIPPNSHLGQAAKINGMYLAMAVHIGRHFRLPWLPVEPDCVPLKPDWCEQLAAAYYSQPKRYMGTIMKTPDEKRCLARMAVYPSNAINDLKTYFASQTIFNVVCGDTIVPWVGDAIVPCGTKSGLFQRLAYKGEADRVKIRPDTVLLRSDKTGGLITALREEANKANGNVTNQMRAVIERIGLPPRSQQEAAKPVLFDTTRETIHLKTPLSPAEYAEVMKHSFKRIERPDMRTKAGRALKAARVKAQIRPSHAIL